MGRFTDELSSENTGEDQSHLLMENLDKPRSGVKSRFFGDDEPVAQEQSTPQPQAGDVPDMPLKSSHVPMVSKWGEGYSTMALHDPNQPITPDQMAALITEKENEEIMAAWKKRQFYSLEELQKKGMTTFNLPGWDSIDAKKLEAADKQGAWVMQQLQMGMPMQVIEAEIAGLQEPMYGPDDLIADIVTGFSYSGYRLAAKQGFKTASKVAAKGTAVDVGFGAIAGGAMTAADMATDNMLVTTVSGLLSPAGAKVFFSMSRASLKQWLKSFAKNNPLEAEKLARAVDETVVKTDAAKEVKKTVKEQVDENVKKAVDKAKGKQTKPDAVKEAVKPKGKAAKLAAAHAQKKPKPDLKADKKPKKKKAKEPTPQEKLQKLAGDKKKVRVDATLNKAEHGLDGAQVTIIDPKSPAKGTTLTIEGDVTKDKIKKAVSDKEKLFAEGQKKKKQAEEKAKKELKKPTAKKTKSFSEKKVAGALEEADVKKPKVVKETEMSGDDFLNLTTGSDVRKDAIKKKVKKGEMEGETTKSAPILVVDKDGKVIAHDGRHRAAKAAEEGKPIKTLVVSEEDYLGQALQSQKFGTKDRGVTVDLRGGIIGGGTMPKPLTETKPRPWSKLTRVAVINRRTGEVMQSDKDLPFKPSERKNVDKVELETRRLRKQMIKKGVSPEDIENGFIAADNQKFVPRTVQQGKVDVKAAVENTRKLRMEQYDSQTDAIIKANARKDAKLKKMAKPSALHRLVHKANKTQAAGAAKQWYNANPDLRKGLELKDIQQASEQAVWEHILLTPMKDLRKFQEGNKAIKAQIGGKINNIAKWTARDYSKELIRQKSSMASIDAVKKALDEGTLKTPLTLEEGKVGAKTDLSNKQVDDLVSGIQDPEVRRAAEFGVSVDELTEGMERAGKASTPADLGRDYKIKMRRTVLPKAGKASALGKKEISKRARKAARKRAFLRQKEAEAKGELIFRTEADVKKLEARQAELQKEIKAAKAARDAAQAKRGKGQGISKEAMARTMEHEKTERAYQKVNFQLAKKNADLIKLKQASKTLEEQGFEPLISINKSAAGDAASDAVAAAKNLDKTKPNDVLAQKIKELEGKGGHYLDMQTLGDIRRIAQEQGNTSLVKEVETIMLREQQRIEIRNRGKETKSAGQTELYSGLPIHKVKQLLLDPMTTAWTRGIDKLGGATARALRNATFKSEVLTHIASGLIEDFGLTKAYRAIRHEFDLAVHQWETIAGDHAQAIRKITGDFETATRKVEVSKKAAQLRARQVAGGSITAFDDKFEAVHKASRRFKRLEDMLTERGLLRDHQFKRLNRSERAKAHKTLRNYEQQFKDTMKKLVELKEDHPKFKQKTREYTDALKAIENRRIELTTRLQIHYKNSGKNYFRVLFNRLNNQKTAMNRFKDMKMQKRWAIRRDNWQVDLRPDGQVVVKQQGKPMKTKSATLSRMIHKGITEEAKDAFLYDFFGRVQRSKRWSRKTKAQGYTRMPKDYEAWGPLAGQYVTVPIYRELMNVHKEMNWFEKTLKRSIGVWKSGKVVWSPRAQARNFISNMILGDILADVNFTTALPKHLKSIAEMAPIKMGKQTDDPILKSFKLDTTLMKTSFAENEIIDAMRWLDPTKLTTAGSKWDALGKAFNKTMMGPARLYSLIEEGMKYTIFKTHVKQGIKDAGAKSLDDMNKMAKKKLIRAAEQKANYALFDYSKVPPVIRWARHGYSPFITFTYKAIPRLTKEFARKPWKAAKWIGGLYVLQKLFDEMSGDSPEEIEAERRVLPHYAQREMLPGQPSHLRLPWKDEEGRAKYFDLSFIVPWGDITEGVGDLSFGSRSIMPNNPVWNLWRDFSANEDVFLEKPLTYKHDTGGEVAIKLMKHAWKAAAPGILDPNSIIKMKRVMFGEKDFRGRKYSTAEAIFDVFLGLKIRRFDYMEEAARRFTELGEVEADMKLEFIREWNRINVKENLTQEQQQEQMEKLFLNMAEDSQRLMDRGYYLLNEDDE